MGLLSYAPTEMQAGRNPRIVALLATYNERRFVGPCIEHLTNQGVETYLIDNDSTDETVKIAERHRSNGLIGVERFARNGIYEWQPLLERKEQLACELDADWMIHLDADELHLPPHGVATLSDALADIDRQGYTAANFLEFAFMPTVEEPDHDHPDFERTLRTYHPMMPGRIPERVNAWKVIRGTRPQLAWSGGHYVLFDGLRPCPELFPMKHYLFLSLPHAIEKYAGRGGYDPRELNRGWHGWRAHVGKEDIRLPPRSWMRIDEPGRPLNGNDPRRTYYFEEALIASADPAHC